MNLQDGHPGHHLTDEELLGRMTAGSMVAFAELYRRYAPHALIVARSVCRDANGADEAVQDGFESIWKSRATYREDRGTVAIWAMSVVRYRAMAIAARRGQRISRETGTESPELSSPAEAVADEAVAADEATQLHAFLAQIPAAQREVITLAFFGQMSHAEIAVHLNLPAGTVKGRMRLGLGKLRTQLDRTA